eukprot:6584703-Prymnesium_polylepis.1
MKPPPGSLQSPVRGSEVGRSDEGDVSCLDRCGRYNWIYPPGRSIQGPSGSISGGAIIGSRPVGLIQGTSQGRTFRDVKSWTPRTVRPAPRQTGTARCFEHCS